MHILVTGASGYIGGSFIEAFKRKYDFSIFSLQENTIDTLNLENIDTILHCAALVHQKTVDDYEKYDAINVKYPIDLAKKAKKSSVKQFVFISTIAVYGDDKKFIDENSTFKPVTPYGESKLEAEKQLLALHDENFTVSIIRPPMVYGKDAPGNINSLINLIKKVPILPFANIDNRRSFIYIGNLIHFIDNIIEKRGAGIFLVSDDRAVSTTELIKHISKELDKKIYLVNIPFFERLLRVLNPSLHKKLYDSLEVNNSSTKETLKYENTYSIEDGIKAMIDGKRI